MAAVRRLTSDNAMSRCSCGRTFRGPGARRRGEAHLAQHTDDGGYGTGLEMAEHAADPINREST